VRWRGSTEICEDMGWWDDGTHVGEIVVLDWDWTRWQLREKRRGPAMREGKCMCAAD